MHFLAVECIPTWVRVQGDRYSVQPHSRGLSGRECYARGYRPRHRGATTLTHSYHLLSQRKPKVKNEGERNERICLLTQKLNEEMISKSMRQWVLSIFRTFKMLVRLTINNAEIAEKI